MMGRDLFASEEEFQQVQYGGNVEIQSLKASSFHVQMILCYLMSRFGYPNDDEHQQQE